jgi:hypothetical protein
MAKKQSDDETVQALTAGEVALNLDEWKGGERSGQGEWTFRFGDGKEKRTYKSDYAFAQAQARAEAARDGFDEITLEASSKPDQPAESA